MATEDDTTKTPYENFCEAYGILKVAQLAINYDATSENSPLDLTDDPSTNPSVILPAIRYAKQLIIEGGRGLPVDDQADDYYMCFDLIAVIESAARSQFPPEPEYISNNPLGTAIGLALAYLDPDREGGVTVRMKRSKRKKVPRSPEASMREVLQ